MTVSFLMYPVLDLELWTDINKPETTVAGKRGYNVYMQKLYMYFSRFGSFHLETFCDL